MSEPYSLRRRLLLWISIPILIAALLTLIIGFFFAWHEVDEVYDAQLVHSAKVMLQLTQHEIKKGQDFELGLENPNLSHEYERNIGFRLWVDTNLVSQSPNTVNFKNFEAPPGFSNYKIGEHTWRFFVFLDPENKIQIEISERYDIRYELVFQIMGALILPGIIFIPLILVIIWIGIRQGMKPITDLSEQVNRRSSKDLSPIAQKQVAKEIQPITHALNELFKRIEESFSREREFTDHAAHELRTPLAAMKTQTQVLRKKTGEKAGSDDGLQNLEASIDRAARLVDQLLALARLQNEDMPKVKVNLSECLQDCIADIQKMTQTKGHTLNVNIRDNVHLLGHEDSLAIMLKNFLENAVKYTPEGGTIDVSLSADGELSICDTGPGIPQAEQEKVFNKFYRADKTGKTGSGLGLSIAKWIADAHNLQISLANNKPQGLSVILKP